MSVQQSLRCSGEIVVLTDLNTSQAQKGRIVFVDRLNENRVIAGMRIYGTPQSRLIIDAYNTANGLAFRTNVDQGTTTEGGKGLPYGFEVLPFSIKSTIPTSISEPSSFQLGPELGACMLLAGRNGTVNVPISSPPSTRYIAKFYQNVYKTNEKIQISIGSESNHHSIHGFKPLFASNGQPIGGTTFLSHSSGSSNEPLDCILYDQTGKVTIPGTIRATTYENLPSVPASDLLPITLDKINNRVGINTTTPNHSLHVVGDAHVTEHLSAGGVIEADGMIVHTQGLNVDGGAVYLTPTTVNGRLVVLGEANVDTMKMQSIPNSSKSNVLMYDTTTKEVSYGPTPSPDLLPITLDKPNNRVGINNATPTEALDVTGTVTASNVNSTGVYRINGVDFVASRNSNSVSVGVNAGSTTQGAFCIAVGPNAGRYTQGGNAVAIGSGAGNSGQLGGAVAIGLNAGITTQGAQGVALGQGAGNTGQGTGAVAIGNTAGFTNQATYGIAIGVAAGNSGQLADAVAIGRNAGKTTQGSGAFALGVGAGETNQGAAAFALGANAGSSGQGTNAVAIGDNSGSTSQGSQAIAIGRQAGRYTQGGNAVAIGNDAGIGTTTAGTGQGTSAVAIGSNAGNNTQGASAVAIGATAGNNTQGSSAVAIGVAAGEASQGQSAIAIGRRAGQTNQHANSIILNATGTVLNSVQASSFYVKPIRNLAGPNTLNYDPTSGEITYTTSSSGSSPTYTTDLITFGNAGASGSLIQTVTLPSAGTYDVTVELWYECVTAFTVTSAMNYNPSATSPTFAPVEFPSKTVVAGYSFSSNLPAKTYAVNEKALGSCVRYMALTVLSTATLTITYAITNVQPIPANTFDVTRKTTITKISV